jgi:flagellar biosynthesis chaperone FliJ
VAKVEAASVPCLAERSGDLRRPGMSRAARGQNGLALSERGIDREDGMTYQDLNAETIEATAPETRPAPPMSSSVSEKGSEAKDKASEVVGQAQSAVAEVASTAKDQARVLTEEAKHQARELMTTTRQQLSEQAEERAQHASRGLRSIADQMQALNEGRPQDAGTIAQWTGEIQERVRRWSDRLESGGVDGVLRDLSSFARRRPLVFLGACMAAGVVVGRLVKDAVGADASGNGAGSISRSTRLPLGGMDDRLPPPVTVGSSEPLATGREAMP